jgi:transcriptional regulator with XRE-family HTH domain
MAIDYMIIGKRIQEKRRSQNMTQENLAEKLQVTVGYISQIERGITKVNLDMLGKISNQFNCNVAEFISDSNSESTKYMDNEFADLIGELSSNEKHMFKNMLESYIAENPSRYDNKRIDE